VKAKPVGIVLVLMAHLAVLCLLALPPGLWTDVHSTDRYFTILAGATGIIQLVFSGFVIRALLAGRSRVINYCWHSFIFIALPLCWAAFWSGFDALSPIILLGLAAANDTGAVAAGKLFGKRRVVPRISPGKTLEGVVGGFAGMFAFLMLVRCTIPHFGVKGMQLFYFLLCQPQTWVFILFACAWFALVGFLGDITFSAIKRKAGIKDFGAILPGHGGMLDRIDALLFIAPWYVLALMLSSPL
jgi:phosphatidate cytidylyltransferase